VLLALAYTLGPISGCHVNPAVTMGFLVSRRMTTGDAIGYWIAQFIGGIVGAVTLWAMFQGSDSYTKSVGLGTDGWGKHSMIGINVGGAFAVEVVLTSCSSSSCWERRAASPRRAPPGSRSGSRSPSSTSSASR